MKPTELTGMFGSVVRLELRPLHGETFDGTVTAGVEALLTSSPELGPTLKVGERGFRVSGQDPRARRRIEDVIQRDLPRIAWIVQTDGAPASCRAVLLQVHEFPSGLLLPDELALHVDDELTETLMANRSLGTFDAIEEFLRQEFLLAPVYKENGWRIIVSAGRSVGSALGSGFRVHGPRLVMDIQRREIPGDDSKAAALFVKRIAPSRSSGGAATAQRLIQADIAFRDASKGSVASAVRTDLNALVQQAGSYLGIWKEYNEVERRSLENEATEFGHLAYSSWSEVREGIRFACPGLDPQGRERLRDCREDRVDLQATEEPADSDERPGGARTFVGAPVDVDSIGVIVRPRGADWPPPPQTGFLSIAVFGDRKRLARREKARDLVASARCPVPWLGLLLEGKPFPVKQRRREIALSPVARKAFKGDPTPAQEMAIDAALNTPDIAIIQGPPGTGKTRVIAALQARLAELGEGESGPFGQTLLTSYQHDAVDNVAAASTAFGLPSFRIGVKSGHTDDGDATERWRRDLVAKLKGSVANQPATPVHVVRRNVRRLALAQQKAPSGNEASADLLLQVLAEAGPWLDAPMAEQLEKLIRQLRNPATAQRLPLERELALRAVAGLPTTAASASDDGPHRATKALIALEGLGTGFLTELETQVISSMANWKGEGVPPGLSVLAELRTALMDRLQPPRVKEAGPLHNVLVEEALLRVQAQLESVARNTAFDASVAVEDLIDELEADPQAVREELSRYASSLASTVQHSVGTDMQAVKLSGIDLSAEEWPRFRTVIVDEAARCNPLDLMIPLSIAERRIVLVGDHRQLPHVLEPSVERELSTTATEATKEALGRSMFERLVGHVRALEQQDGVKRYVRLDTQYRMPPALGTFVNDAFYAPYGEQFSNGRPATDFAHGLTGQYAGKVAAWVDMPLQRGQELGGKSKSRPLEADWIAGEVKRLMEDRPDLTVGVITFYSAQVEALNRALGHQGIVEQDPQGVWQPTSPWKSTSGTTESRARLRVGTVDSFQGMEFDIVFLSLVRSNRLPTSDAASLRKKFGFLLLENRVCVAMSRQQRLLVVVGDADMFKDDVLANEPGVSALRQFHMFCGGAHGVRI
ncbi:MAG: AAA family ATPase [Phycisphaerales bacterium]|nr:AAA family ATPase [Phycisphaerales bacterium]